ncbi:mitochondrial nicotinamide adenine dinucleotide transporter SLC25A51-like [Apostichopus japonicus]|uniref:mitochondrial nicotinamide adenine dinucleotide transporter SLC25A51-like n=1 Tax=Stichopus japonicus TaxID=307972 RepID=UPI003AB7EED8
MESSREDVTVPLMDHSPDWVEYACGGGAAFFNIIITFPLHKVIFRQQVFGISGNSAFMQVKKEGLSQLYRGVLPPLLQKTFSVSLMFGLYDQYSRILRSNCPFIPQSATLHAAAILSGTTEAILVPFERVQTILQDQRRANRFSNTIHAFRVLRMYGIGEYYRGLTAILLRNGPSNAVFFSLRGKVNSVLPEAKTSARKVRNDFVAGAVTGAFISTVWYPVNVVKSRMQSKIGGEFRSFVYTFKQIYKERNCRLRNMFLGVHLNYSRALISWGIINAAYEILKNCFMQD